MPSRSKRFCTFPGCGNLTSGGRCEEHKKQEQKQYDRQRGTAHERGYNYEWQRFRKGYLTRNPLCVDCLAVNTITPSNEVHHKIALSKGGEKYNEDNLKALCHECHSKRTMKGE